MKKILILLTITISFIGHTLSVKAQVKSTEWIVYDTTNSGLPSNGVKSIVIDSIGNKWIGTGEGLVKFDNITWTIWDTLNSGIPSNYVDIVALDNSENKWLGTFPSSGLTKFDGITWTTWNTSNSGLPSNYIYAITFDDSGNVWLGTIGGLTKFDGTTWTTWNTSNSNIPGNTVTSIAIDSAGNKWVGCDGVVKFDGITWTTFYSVIFPVCPASSIITDQINNVWIGYNGCGLSYYDGNGGINYNTSNSPLPVNGATALVLDSIGNLWLSSQGLVKFNSPVWTIWDTTSSYLPDNNIGTIQIDKFGNKWIGTFYGGLAVFNEGGITGIIESKQLEKLNSIKLIPNPASKFIDIIGITENTNIQFFDITGKLIKREIYRNRSIDISNLLQGVYVVKVNTGKEIISTILIKE